MCSGLAPRHLHLGALILVVTVVEIELPLVEDVLHLLDVLDVVTTRLAGTTDETETTTDVTVTATVTASANVSANDLAALMIVIVILKMTATDMTTVTAAMTNATMLPTVTTEKVRIFQNTQLFASLMYIPSTD